jgi:UDP-N-acetylmuramoylalanine--D-glutamate ligase
MSLTNTFIEKAKLELKRIAFPEYDDERIISAAKYLRDNKICIPVIVGKEIEGLSFEKYFNVMMEKVRCLVLVGEVKESMNRVLGEATQTFLVGSFDESVLLAYQKSRTGDTILLCPGNDSTDVFRDYEEKGNYYKKLIFQL